MVKSNLIKRRVNLLDGHPTLTTEPLRPHYTPEYTTPAHNIIEPNCTRQFITQYVRTRLYPNRWKNIENLLHRSHFTCSHY
ncbi:hypothetical protein GDO78_000323 [Eleutherodactylus coqui]|uniref:Uncharacterized protein n=1 Tax=Eleutherodactylus coqui TaxID=57060 RepID=A0A8J6KHF5_ELECQ|nr:hypothetical protein GDO78_000323 [Eleutherodactylus coqui]